MNQQINTTNSNIERLKADLAAQQALLDLAMSDETLAGIVGKFNPLLHHSSKLYGTSGCLGFNISKELAEVLPALFDNAVQSQRANGFWHYGQFPYTDQAREIIRKKDQKVQFGFHSDCVFEMGVNSFSVSFYYRVTTGQIIEISVDYGRVITGQNYNQWPKSIKIPYLKKNPNYAKSRKAYEPEYIGVNFECRTNNFQAKQLNPFVELIELNEQFLTDAECAA